MRRPSLRSSCSTAACWRSDPNDANAVRRALELGRRPAEHEMAPRLGPGCQLCQQPRLADPRFADERGRGRLSPIECVEEAVQRAELFGTPDEVLGKEGHVVLSRAP